MPNNLNAFLEINDFVQNIGKKVANYFDSQEDRWSCYLERVSFDNVFDLEIELYFTGPYSATDTEYIHVDETFIDYENNKFDFDRWLENYKEEKKKIEEYRKKEQEKKNEERRKTRIRLAIDLLKENGYQVLFQGQRI